MTNPLLRRRLVCAITTAALVGAIPATSAHAADEGTRKPPTTKFDPTTLQKGTTKAPYVDRKMLHDGKKKLKLNVPHDVWNVYRLKRGYLVETDDPNSGWGVILYRVGPRGKVTKLRRFGGHIWSVTVDSRGEKVAVQTFKMKGGTPLTVFDAFSNKVLRRKNIGKRNVLNYVRGRILMTRGIETSTLTWYRPGKDTSKRIAKVPGWVQFADPSINVIGTYPKGEAPGLVVRRFKQPRKKLWQFSSDKGIPDGIWFSPNGKRAVTSVSTDDRPAFGTTTIRRVSDGSVVRRFKARMFGSVGWENNRTIVVEAAAHAKASRVRCTIGGKCTRVSRLVKGANDFYALNNLDTLFFDLKLFS